MKDHKSLWDLMLKGTEYEDILHGEYPTCEDELIRCLDGFDFVVEEWLESMKQFEIKNSDQIATTVMMAIIDCRFAIISFFDEEHECPDLTESTDYLEVLKTIRRLKQAFMSLSKSYAQTRYLANWYLDLPLKIQAGFKHINNQKIKNRIEWRDEGGLYK